MKNLGFVFLFSLFVTTVTAQAQSYGSYASLEGESGKCYAQCLIPGDTTITTETIEVKPGWHAPKVIEGYAPTTPITYTVKEECSTCAFEEKRTTKTDEEVVLIKPGYWKYTTTPCVWETVYDTIVVKEETVKYILTDPEFKDDQVRLTIEGTFEEGICIPAVTGTETRTVEIKAECVDVEVAEYEWEDEAYYIEVAAATQRWVKRQAEGNCLSDDPEDCMVWCLEEVPAVMEKCVRKVRKDCPYGYEDNGEYCYRKTNTPTETKNYEVITCVEDARFEKNSRSVEKKVDVDIEVLACAATYTKVVEEAEIEVIARRVIVEPAGLDSIYMEPVYETKALTIEEQRVRGTITGTPAVEESCTKQLCVEPDVITEYHEPIYKTVTKIKINEGSFSEWQEVLCSSEVNSYTIGQIQHALYDRGYNPGPIDNAMGKKTKTALIQFQKRNGLPVGQLDLKTLKALGLNYDSEDTNQRD